MAERWRDNPINRIFGERKLSARLVIEVHRNGVCNRSLSLEEIDWPLNKHRPLYGASITFPLFAARIRACEFPNFNRISASLIYSPKGGDLFTSVFHLRENDKSQGVKNRFFLSRVKFFHTYSFLRTRIRSSL